MNTFLTKRELEICPECETSGHYTQMIYHEGEYYHVDCFQEIKEKCESLTEEEEE